MIGMGNRDWGRWNAIVHICVLGKGWKGGLFAGSRQPLDAHKWRTLKHLQITGQQCVLVEKWRIPALMQHGACIKKFNDAL